LKSAKKTNSWPPPISTSIPGSFAWKTMRRRKPAIVKEVLDNNTLAKEAINQLRSLQEDLLLPGTVNDPFAEYQFDPGMFAAEEIEVWRGELNAYAGRSWLDLPWYFAESIFYLQLLFAFGYYHSGSSTFEQDPFAAVKTRELIMEGGGKDIAARIINQLNNTDAEEALQPLLYYSLWGNRMDLSYRQVAAEHREREVARERKLLLIDDSLSLVEILRGVGNLEIVLDNSGSELVCDLLLVSSLLRQRSNLKVTLHAKKRPFYVSDALKSDVLQAVEILIGHMDDRVAAEGKYLKQALKVKSLRLKEHFFWNGPLHFTDLPLEIKEHFSAADLVIFKGDANYRRLLSDRSWDPFYSMAEITDYFPAPLAVLRTMKSDVVVGLNKGQLESLETEDPEWKINGRRGIIQFIP